MLKKYLYFIIPVLATALCSLLSFSSLDSKVADWFQRPLKSTVEHKNVVMINVDDTAIDQIGSWPFSRDVYADSLITLRELGTEAVVFDLSFVDKSQAKIDEPYVREILPDYVDADIDSLNDKIFEVLGQYAEGTLQAEDSEYVAEDMLSTTDLIRNSIKTNISHLVESQDAALATALKYFDNSFLTLTFDDATEISDEQKEYLSNYIALDNIEIQNDTKTPEFSYVLPAIPDFMVKAKKAGFVNAEPDKDGYLRRIHLVYKYNGKYYGQLVFVPILQHYGNPKVIVKNNEIILQNCKISETVTKDIKIPRSEDGSILVKYPKKDYIDYIHIGLWSIYRLSKKLETDLAQNINELADMGFFDYCEEDESPFDAYGNANYVKDSLLNQEDDFTFDDYLHYRQLFFTTYEHFLNGEFESYLCEDYPDDADYINEVFTTCREQYKIFMDARQKVSDKVKDAICIVGTVATSTSDYGLNQYEEHYPNPGVHYTIANMLLDQDFVDDSPVWISILLAFLLCIGYSFATHRIKSTGRQIITGVSFIIANIILFLLFYFITKCYVGLVIPLFSLSITFIITSIVGFVTASHDKRFITNAFSQCLSKEVVDEIVANPSSFKLGGQRLEMTAMFTDIQKFSGF
nr:CHASE2 domain-containing protein [Treponema sp.]